MIPLAREGWKEMFLGTLLLGALALLAGSWYLPLALPFVLVWCWLVSFFRDPRRHRTYEAGELCSPADGTVTEISHLDEHPALPGPVVRIGIFLSIFNVHVNRAPCRGRVRSLAYAPGRFLDARHPDSGRLNESNTIVLDTAPTMPGPVIVRQVAGKIARRIICHGNVGDEWVTGQRFGLIKFGSRTELIIPWRPETEICVSVGTKVRAGRTIMARQPVLSSPRPGEELPGGENTADPACQGCVPAVPD